MTFDHRDIRPAMDVYTRDNVYLGTVLAVEPGPAPGPRARRPPEHQGSQVSGELLGPMPTQPVGNQGPVNQSARAGFASAADDAPPIGQGRLLVGRWQGWRGRRAIPLAAVQSVALERVVLALTSEQLDR